MDFHSVMQRKFLYLIIWTKNEWKFAYLFFINSIYGHKVLGFEE
jgi:hypothetical protein